MKKYRKQAAAVSLALALSVSAGAASGFSDVPDGSWYAEAAGYCQNYGLMAGSGGRFSPDDVMTRAMLVTVLHQMKGAPAASAAGFSDVAATDWYAGPAAWAQSEGLLEGIADGTFSPMLPADRELTAVLLWRCAGSPSPDAAAAFTDTDQISPYARDAVSWLHEAGMIAGLPDGRFGPKENLTRAQAAGMLMRYHELLSIPLPLSALDFQSAPCGICAADDGRLLVCDNFNNVVWLADPQSDECYLYAGQITVPDITGAPIGGYLDTSAEISLFRSPWAIAPFLEGYAISDPENNVVRLAAGGIVQTLNCVYAGSSGLTGSVPFQYPTGLAAADDGTLFISDTHQNRILRVDQEGSTTIYASGLSDPMGLCWKNGSLYVAETGANRIVKITNGQIEVVAGSGTQGFENGPASTAAFSAPQGLTVADNGTIYVADTSNSAVRQIRNGAVTTLFDRASDDTNTPYPVSPTGLLLRDGILFVTDSFSAKTLVYLLS